MWRRLAAGVLATLALSAVLGQSPPATTRAVGPQTCGPTTLHGTIVYKDGKLVCGPGQPLKLREDLGTKAKPGRRGTPILSFAALTDFQLPDEESPLRGEFFDKCTTHELDAAFRWNDTLLPHLLNSHIQAVNRMQRGPVTGRPFDFAVQLGDAAENQQYNEVRAFIDLLDGGTVVDPDSGRDGYDGNQGSDPYASPVKGRSLRDLANEPFWATGLRRPDGSPLPWYTVMGNHDAKVRGVMPNSEAWKTFAKAWVTGGLMVNDLPPDMQQRVCKDPAVMLDPAFWATLAAHPGSVRLVEADPERRLLDREDWLREHDTSRGLPAGHRGTMCPVKDVAGRQNRACYTVDVPPAIPGEPPIHLIVLDTAADEGLDSGNIDQAQWDWLNKDLKKHSSCFYATDNALTCDETGNPTSLIVVMSHHSSAKMSNTTPRTDGGTAKTGADLQKLLLLFPNVIMHAAGHTHQNKIWQHMRANGTGGYFEVNTSAIADWPHQSRTIEIVDNHDGTMSIYAITFDGAAPVDPATMRWSDDPTPETDARFGKQKAAINEEYLAAVARWVGANDPQHGHDAIENLATDMDKNVELILTHPTGGAKRPGLLDFKPPVYPRPRFPFPWPFPQPQFPIAAPTGPFPFPSTPVTPPQFPSAGIPAQPTSRGIGSPADGPALQLREYVMTVLAAAGVMWLMRSRIRRNQIGL
ncbi:MAG TPA: hypothetical protein VM841_08490 [Actinomycetota bacterium]|nr:hypothetical protein [Actinomycetota bacterium]